MPVADCLASLQNWATRALTLGLADLIELSFADLRFTPQSIATSVVTGVWDMNFSRAEAKKEEDNERPGKSGEIRRPSPTWLPGLPSKTRLGFEIE